MLQDWQQLARTLTPVLERVGSELPAGVPGLKGSAVSALVRKVHDSLTASMRTL